MTDYTRKQMSHECQPDHNPADQPNPPGGECCDLETWQVPDPYKPPTCPDPPCACNCPERPKETEHCLENLIDKQTKEMTTAEKAKAFKAELESLLTKAKAASLEYTVDKYDQLLKQWERQDREIAELIRKLVCAVPCWRCVIECYVCPLLNELHDAEQQLFGDDTLNTDMHSIYDLRYWHERNKAWEERRFQRIKTVLAAWEKPAQTIEKRLADNAKLIVDCSKALGSDPSKAVYDVFLKLVPMHLAIAPPNKPPTEETTTWIDKKYTQFCECDTSEPDNCCGPDVGKKGWSLRQRLIGPQPYLIHPSEYFRVICCLVEKRFEQAKTALAKATAALEGIEIEIKRYKDQIENGLKDFEKSAKAKIPTVIHCCGEQLEKSDQEPTKTR